MLWNIYMYVLVLVNLIVDTVNAHDSALGHMGYPN